MKRTLFALVASTTLLACGGGGGDNPDAPGAPDARVLPDALPTGCSYVETNDIGNDATPEVTGATIGATAFTACGQIDARAPVMNIVDNDAYAVTLAAASSVMLRLSITGPAPAQTLLAIDIADSMGVIRQGLFVGNHAVMTVNLPMGAYSIEAFAVSQAAPATPIPYKLSVVIDTPDTRCPTLAGAATFTEANDGAANSGNNMMEVRFGAGGGLTLTALPTDNPEPTAVTLAEATSVRFDGTSAAGTNPADEYLDRDTFIFTTGPMTTQVDLRLDWPGADTDVDFFFLPVPAGTPPTPVAFMSGLQIGDSAPEFGTHAVLPDTQYWVWVGAYDVNAAGGPQGVPKQYGATLCGTNFAP